MDFGIFFDKKQSFQRQKTMFRHLDMAEYGMSNKIQMHYQKIVYLIIMDGWSNPHRTQAPEAGIENSNT